MRPVKYMSFISDVADPTMFTTEMRSLVPCGPIDNTDGDICPFLFGLSKL